MKTKIIITVFLLCFVLTSYGQWSSTNLSEPKAYIGVTALGSKAYFSGGMNSSGLKSKIEIFNSSTGEWDPTQQDLSVARDLVTAANCGSKVFFAGGVDFYSSGNVFSTVDIYDTLTHEWSVVDLSAARLNITALSYGNKVLFAGGANPQVEAFDNIDIYDAETDTWSVGHLPVPRVAYGGVVNDLGILPGGFDSSGVTKRVDIYNFTTGTWSVDSLSVARAWAGVAIIGDRMFIAGGVTENNVQSNVVDIYDATTGTWDTAYLSLARSFADNQNAVTVSGKVYFIGGGILNLNGPYWDDAYNRIDIYDPVTGSWSIDSLRSPYPYVHRAAVSLGDQFLVAGGITLGGAYKSFVEIFQDPTLIHVPADYLTIQEGINAASDGDTVLVAENTYHENINFGGKHILVASEFLLDDDTSHISNTIIDGSQPVDPDLGSVVNFDPGTDTTSVLCGFTITRGTGTFVPVAGNARLGGGVIFSSGGKLLNNYIEYNNLSNEAWTSGGGIFAGGPLDPLPWVVLRGNRISHNKSISSSDQGAGAGMEIWFNLVMDDNQVSFNVANGAFRGDGGGARISGNFGPIAIKVTNNSITHNQAISNSDITDIVIGGGLDVFRDCSGIVANNTISFNNAEVPGDKWCYGTGVMVETIASNDFIFENNLITGNTFTGGTCMGGGLCIYDTGGKFRNNVVQNNIGTNGGGVGIAENISDKAILINNTISGNQGVKGGGLYTSSADAVVINSIIWGNTAPNGASIYQEGSALEVRYSDVEGVTVWPGEGNKNADPGFIDDACHIDEFSPCTDSGVDSVLINDSVYYSPLYDIEGAPRPYRFLFDIGAYECDIFSNVPDQNAHNDDPNMIKVYPNPFSDHTTISYNLECDSRVNISLYGSQGSFARLLLSEEQSKGSHTLEYNGADLQPGIYFIQLTTDDYRLTTGKLVKY
jgi:hypothetical protein